MNRISIIKKILGLTMVITMAMSMNFSYANSTGSIDEGIYKGLGAVLDSKNNTISQNADFLENIKYTKDRKRAILTVKLPSTENVKVDVLDSKISIVIPNKIATYNAFTKDINDRLIGSYELVSENENYIFNINLKTNVKSEYTVNEATGEININLDKLAYSNPKIVIDAGHGGNDPGAVVKSVGVNEKTLNLQVANILRDKLTAAGYEVVMNRDTDYFVPLKDRYTNANELDSDLFVSIHHNSAANAAINGIETLHHSSRDNKEIAVYIQDELIKNTGAGNRGTKVRTDLAVLNGTKMPAVLVELGFMTNASELSKLRDSNYQNTLADSILVGINRYFGR
ncbi:MAG: N-acetylmuramoyl-L-alanine amidase family protein [Proteocatella sp.]